MYLKNSEGSMEKKISTSQIERDKSAKFIELANKRVNRALKDLALVGNLANRRNYAYSEDQAKKIVKALQLGIDQVKASFLSDGAGQQSNFEL
jgi:mitochondrial fission protein ELM1